MPGIDQTIIVHYLNISPNFKPVFWKCKTFNEERYAVIEEKVQKLLKAGFIRPLDYSEWLVKCCAGIESQWRLEGLHRLFRPQQNLSKRLLSFAKN